MLVTLHAYIKIVPLGVAQVSYNYTVEPPTTDYLYYKNHHNVDRGHDSESFPTT